MTIVARGLLAFLLWSASGARAQDIPIPEDALIRLERTACYGTCPVYTVTIDARGGVVYDGKQFVRVTGREQARIARSAVAKLLASAERMHFFDLRDAYRVIQNPDGTTTTITDLPTKIVTITIDGRSKRVEDYVGGPDALAELEREIDAAAGTKRWVFVDEQALDALVRSGWLASGEEGARLLQEASDATTSASRGR